MKPVVKKSLIAVAAVVATPIVILVLLAVLLYVPSVQNWAVKQVASYASESTGMTVRVDHVRLRFPLDLTVDGFLATQPNDSLRHKTDTIADARQLTVSVRLRPLFQIPNSIQPVSYPRHVSRDASDCSRCAAAASILMTRQCTSTVPNCRAHVWMWHLATPFRKILQAHRRTGTSHSTALT